MLSSHPEGFLAIPSSGPGAGVLVLHAWWGLNDTIKAFCNRLAEAGFVAFAPDLYHGQIAGTIPEAESLVKTLNANPSQAGVEIAEATRFLSRQVGDRGNDLAVIGFSLGAPYALDLSNADPEHIRAVVVFYGTGAEDFSNSRAEYQGHFAENDPYEERPYIDQLEQTLRQAGRPVTFYHYPGTGHWFMEPDRADAYNPAAATLAWERALAFLAETTNG